MDHYILDTNLFFNMEAGLDLGEKAEQVIKKLTTIGAKLNASKEARFLMPPRVVEEFLGFFEDPNQGFLKEFLATIISKSPSYQESTIPAAVVYQLVEDIRQRSYRGLNIAEEEIQKAGQMMMGKETLSRKDFQITIGSVTKNFRERYRQATRFGFLDSLADLDLIMLAKETEGFLISSDEGVIKWGRVFGVKEIQIPVFGEKMKKVLSE